MSPFWKQCRLVFPGLPTRRYGCPDDPSWAAFARDAGNLPIRVKHLDFGYYLPLFVEGLSEKEAPYDYVAVQATRDLIAVGGRDCRLFTLLPVVVSKVRVLLKSEDPVVFHRGLEVVRLLMTCDAETAEPGFENMMGVAMARSE